MALVENAAQKHGAAHHTEEAKTEEEHLPGINL